MRQDICVRMGDSVGIVTVDVRPCSVCRRRPHTRECDGLAPHRASGTCDAKLCEDCRVLVPQAGGGEPLDLCPECARQQSGERRRGLFHVELAQPWAWALTSAQAPCMFPRADVAEGRRRWVPAPHGLAGSWLAVWAKGYDEATAQWMCSALGLDVPPALALPTEAYVALAELSECTSVCNDGRAFREPWWGGTGRTSGTYAWWVEACAVEPLGWPGCGQVALTGKHLQPLASDVVAELRRRYEATVSGRWWPPRYEPPRPRAPLHDDSPVLPMLEHPEQGQLL